MNKILIIDIETTGFLQKGGSIVELGAVELNLDNGEITIVYSETCKEDILSAKHRKEPFGWIFRNSDLTVEAVRDSRNAETVLAEFQEVINDYPLGCTAFNKRFDFDFLRDRGLSFPKELDCPMILSTNICKLPAVGGRSGYKWPKVEEAYKFFFPESNYVERHRGGDDAYHEAQIVYELYKMGVFKVEIPETVKD